MGSPSLLMASTLVSSTWRVKKVVKLLVTEVKRVTGHAQVVGSATLLLGSNASSVKLEKMGQQQIIAETGIARDVDSLILPQEESALSASVILMVLQELVGMNGRVPVQIVAFQTSQHDAVVISARLPTLMGVTSAVVHRLDQVTGAALDVVFLTSHHALNASNAKLHKVVVARKLPLMMNKLMFNWTKIVMGTIC